MYLCTYPMDNIVEVLFLKFRYTISIIYLVSLTTCSTTILIYCTSILDISIPDSSSSTAGTHTALLGLTVQGSVLLDGCVVVVLMITGEATVGENIR